MNLDYSENHSQILLIHPQAIYGRSKRFIGCIDRIDRLIDRGFDEKIVHRQKFRNHAIKYLPQFYIRLTYGDTYLIDPIYE